MIILIFVFAFLLMIIPYEYADEFDRLSFGEDSVAHMKQNTGYWKSESEKKKAIIVNYLWWFILIMGTFMVVKLYGNT